MVASVTIVGRLFKFFRRSRTLGTRSRAIRRFTSIARILLRLKRDVGKVGDAFCVYHYRLEAYATLSLQAGSLCYFETGASRP